MFLYFCLILSAARRAYTFDVTTGAGITSSPWGVTTAAKGTISPGNLKMFLSFFVSLIFLYFSLIFLAVIWAFLPGCSSAIVSKVYIISSLSLISSLFVSVSTTAGEGHL